VRTDRLDHLVLTVADIDAIMEWPTGLLSRLGSRDVDTVRALSSFSSAPRQPPSRYRRIIGVSCGFIADESCYSRSVNPFSSVYSTAIRPSCTCATS
jgi:hypothetical protein